MDNEENSINILEAVNKKHPYLQESKLPIMKSEEDILIEIQQLEDSVSTKKYLIRLMNDTLKGVDIEIARWEKKKDLLDNYSEELKDYEKKLQDKIIKIRQSRKEVAMDALLKQKMSEELRANLPELIQNYGKLMQEPSEITKVKFSSEIAENQSDVIASIREKVKQSEKKEQEEIPEEPKKEKGKKK